MFEVRLPVQWGEMDALGHVNNVVFLRWFEEARIAVLDAAGLRGRRDQTGVGPILASSACQYRSPVVFPDIIISRAWVRSVGQTSVVLSHQVLSTAQGRVVADGESVVVQYDYHQGQKTPISSELRARLLSLPRP